MKKKNEKKGKKKEMSQLTGFRVASSFVAVLVVFVSTDGSISSE